MLAAELQAGFAAAEGLPEENFRQAHVAAKLAGGCDLGASRL